MMFISVLSIFTIVNKLIISLFLFFKRDNSFPTKVLSFIVFLPALTVLSNYLLYLHEYRFSFLIFLNQVGVQLIATLIYIYCLSMMGVDVRRDKKLPFYFTAALIPIGCWIMFQFFYSAQEQEQLCISAFYSPDILLNTMNFFSCFMFMVFLSLSVYKVRRHNLHVNKVFTGTEKIKLGYLNEFITLMWLLGFILGASYAVIPEFYIEAVEVPILSNIFYFYIVYQSFNNSVLFTENEFLDFQKNLRPLQDLENEKYQKSVLGNEQLQEYALQLNLLLETRKLYLDPELTIQKLAEASGLPSNKVSEVINRKFNQNFFDFVNSWRVNHAKECLKDSSFDAYTFEAIAEACGFGSKTAFNRAFKKATGLTPSSFKKSKDDYLTTEPPAKQAV